MTIVDHDNCYTGGSFSHCRFSCKGNSGPAALYAALALLTLITGCATLPPRRHQGSRDPFERLNRTTVQGRRLPGSRCGHSGRACLHRGDANLCAPGHRQCLRKRPYLGRHSERSAAGEICGFWQETTRLILNSTVGLAGLLDPATAVGLPKDDNDFGLTLGTWGIPPGPLFDAAAIRAFEYSRRIRTNSGRLSVAAAVHQERLLALGRLRSPDAQHDPPRPSFPPTSWLDQQNAYDRYGVRAQCLPAAACLSDPR